MIKRYRGTFLKGSVPLIFIIYIACWPGNKKVPASRQSAPAKTTLMETIHLAVGDSTRLHFKSLATAGYLWQYKQDHNGIVTISTESATGPPPARPGESPDEIFKIVAIASGTVHLIFKQQRIWQEEAPAAVKEYVLIIIE